MPTQARYADRLNLVIYLETRDAADGVVLGHAVDVTAEGVRIIGEHPLEPGRIYSLEIQSPCRRAVLVRAECRWSRPDLNPDFHAAGLRFVEIDEASLRLIGAISSRHTFRT